MKALLFSACSCGRILLILVLAWTGLSARGQTCSYDAMDPLNRMSPNLSMFPAGSYGDDTSFSPGRYCESSVVPGMGFSIQMTCDTDEGADAPAVYELQVTFRTHWLVVTSRSIVYALSASPGTVLDRSSTSAFQHAMDRWTTACLLTNSPGVLHPTVTFVYQSGEVRFNALVYIDRFRFVKIPSWNPPLSIRSSDADVTLSWSTNASGFGLFQCDNLSLGQWTVVTNPPVLTNGQNAVTLPVNPYTCQFFRLQY